MYPFSALGIIAEILKKRRWKLTGKRGLLEPRLGHHDKMTEGEKMPEFLPSLNLCKSVRPQDEEERSLLAVPEMADGIDGVRSSRSFEFNIGGKKERVRCGGKPDHLQPVSGVHHLFHCLVRGVGRRDKDCFMETKGFPKVLCSPQVTQMNGIESSPKKTNPSLCCI